MARKREQDEADRVERERARAAQVEADRIARETGKPLGEAAQAIGQVTETITPGKGVLHMEFAPRGREVWLSVRDENRVEIRDARSHEVLAEIPARAPSGIFFTDRAHQTGL